MSIRKTVRFYDLRMLPKNGQETVQVQAGFWSRLGGQVEAKSPAECDVMINQRRVHGEYWTCRTPAQRYFYIGKVRPRSDWPDTLDPEGVVGELELSVRDKVLLEKTYVVPFGAANRIAVLAMSQSSPRVSTLERWFTKMAGLNPAERQLTLVPILDRRIAELLEESVGATVLQVHTQPNAEIPDGGGETGTAIRAATAVSPELDVVLKLSLANRAGSASTKTDLLRAAQWVRGDWAKSAEVSLQLPGDDGDSFHTEHVDLVAHHFTRREKFDITSEGRPSEESVISGITDAIESFNQAFA